MLKHLQAAVQNNTTKPKKNSPKTFCTGPIKKYTNR